MMDQDILTPIQYEEAASRNLDIQDNPRIASRQPAYFQQVNIELKRYVGDRFEAQKAFESLPLWIRFPKTKLEKSIARKRARFI